MTPAEVETQRVNFAWGNAPRGNTGTIEAMRAVAELVKR